MPELSFKIEISFDGIYNFVKILKRRAKKLPFFVYRIDDIIPVSLVLDTLGFSFVVFYWKLSERRPFIIMFYSTISE